MVVKVGFGSAAATRFAICAMVWGGCVAPPGGAMDDAGVDVATRTGPSAGEGGGAALDGGAESASSDADAGGCHPIGVSGFKPPGTVPRTARSLACQGFFGDGGFAALFGDACLAHALTYPSCASFDVGDAAGAAQCRDCLVSQPTAEGTYSGVVSFLATVAVVNYSGCVQLVDPTEAGAACALAVQSAAACLLYACQSTCPVTDEASVAALTNCTNEATFGACVGYALRANACLAAEQGDGGTPVATICFPGSSPQAKYLSFAHYLCGGG